MVDWIAGAETGSSILQPDGVTIDHGDVSHTLGELVKRSW